MILLENTALSAIGIAARWAIAVKTIGFSVAIAVLEEPTGGFFLPQAASKDCAGISSLW